jgi:hypothetical protein
MSATWKGVPTVSQAIREATAQSPTVTRRKGFKAELDGLRERMRTLGFGYDEIAAEVSRRYQVRPRQAYRLAWGWTQDQAAARFNELAAGEGTDLDGRASMTGPHLCEVEQVRHEAPCNRVEVKDRHRRLVAARRRSWGQPGPGDAGEGGKQPRQRQDVPVLPDGAGLASEAGRCTRGTGVVKLHKARASSNPVDMGWFAVRTRPPIAGRGTPGLVILAGREATVKACGVAVARLLEQSRAPSPLIGSW